MPIKTQEQLDWQAMHRVRDRLVGRRTSLINEIRGFLLEAHTSPQEPARSHWNAASPLRPEDAEQNLSPRLRWLLARMWQEWQQLEIDIQAITDESFLNRPVGRTFVDGVMADSLRCDRDHRLLIWVGAIYGKSGNCSHN